MSMKTIWLDAAKLQRFLAVAMTTWTRDAVEAALVEHGWARRDATGTPEVIWGDDYASERLALDVLEDNPEGWWMELGAPPSEDGGDSGIQLPCAYAWPAFGVDPTAEAAEDELDADFGAGWLRVPAAGPDQFEVEYQRIGLLVADALGTPDRLIENDMAKRQVVWHVPAGTLVLHLSDDIATYSHYDVIALRVGPTAVWE